MSSSGKTVPTWKQFNRPWYEKLWKTIADYFIGVGLMLWGVIKIIPVKVWGLIRAIGGCFKGLWLRFIKGDWRTKISYLIMGFGCFSRSPKQILKGLLLFAVEVLFVLFMVFLGAPNLSKLSLEGLQGPGFVNGVYQDGESSLQILIFSVMSFFFMIFFVAMYISNTKICYKTQLLAQAGKPLSTMGQQLNYALNDGYHVTILALPILGVIIVSVLPLITNIFIAFTNYQDKTDPIFVWNGFKSFTEVFRGEYGSVIWSVLGWTLIWALFATFTNFFFGMFLAMMINRKTIRLKMMWRLAFMLVIAIPDFITLLMMSNFFSYSRNMGLTGAFNKILVNWFGFGESANVDWFSQDPMHTLNSTMPRMMVIIINMWRGMPYTMLATMGILMNIPAELYESSRIDGAGPVRRFISITFPYIMFVMGPQLLTTFTGNINNFNVIFFLTGGGPVTDAVTNVGETDLLITWLYKLTIQNSNREYNLGAVIGIFTFLITSFFALIVFNSSKSVKQEDTFQ